ncbi:FxsA family protein [Patescibacteria group bacterium]|nr:FxsA family protein [Patescibacteria group bacterium]
MFGKFLALFIIVPLLELALLIEVGKYLGVWNTIALVLVTAVAGAMMMQLEGLRVWNNLQQDLMSMRMPTDNIINGVLILIGGIVLLTPGIITDIIGITLLIPFTRSIYRKILKKKFEYKVRTKADIVEIKEIQ